MSQSVVIDRQWANVLLTATGTGAAAVSGEILTCTSIVGDTAKATKYVQLRPGEMLKVTCMARRTSGSDDTSGRVAVFNQSGTVVDYVRVISQDWREYVLTYVHSLVAPEGSFCGVDFGVMTADAGTVEYTKPTLEVLQPQIGALRTLACGLIVLAAGAPSINAAFTNFGLRSLSYNAGTKTLTITVDRTSGANHSSPLFFVGMTQNGNGLKIEPKVGSYSAAAGTVQVQFADTTTGLSVDISALGTMYMWFKAEI